MVANGEGEQEKKGEEQRGRTRLMAKKRREEGG